VRIGDRVRVNPASCPWPGYSSERWLVRDREGDRLTLSLLGRPEISFTTTTEHLVDSRATGHLS